MKKILFVYDDYSELTQTDALFKKIGFDTVGISNELSLNEQLIGFNPDLVVIAGRDLKFNSVTISQKLKDYSKFTGRVLVGLKKNFKLNPMEIIKMRMDASIEMPIEISELMSLSCHLLGLDGKAFLEKLQKLHLNKAAAPEKIRVDGAIEVSKEPVIKVDVPAKAKDLLYDAKRAQKYQNIVNSTTVNVHISSHSKNEIKTRVREMKKDYNFEELEKIDEQRIEFAKALLSKEKKAESKKDE